MLKQDWELFKKRRHPGNPPLYVTSLLKSILRHCSFNDGNSCLVAQSKFDHYDDGSHNPFTLYRRLDRPGRSHEPESGNAADSSHHRSYRSKRYRLWTRCLANQKLIPARPCAFFLAGRCLKGDLCTYSHDEHSICRYDSADPGSCRHGTKCLFLHVNPTSNPMISAEYSNGYLSKHQFEVGRGKPVLNTRKKRSTVHPHNNCTHTAGFSTADDNDNAATPSNITINSLNPTNVMQTETTPQPEAANDIEVNGNHSDSEDEVVYKGDKVGGIYFSTIRCAHTSGIRRTSLKFLIDYL